MSLPLTKVAILDESKTYWSTKYALTPSLQTDPLRHFPKRVKGTLWL